MDAIAAGDETVSATAIARARAPAPVPVPARTRRRWLIWLRNGAIALVLLVFAAWLVLFVTKGRFLKHSFERIVGGQIARQVAVGGDFQLYFDPFALKFRAEKISVGNAPWASRPALFAADSVEVRANPVSLLFGQRHIYTIALAGGAADLEWDKAHAHNTWTFGGAKTAGEPFAMPRIDRASVVGTHVRYVDPSLQLLADLAIDPIDAHDTRIGQAIKVAGDGRARTTPFRLAATLGSPDTAIGGGRVDLSVRLWAARSVVDVAGQLPAIGVIDGVPLKVHATGGNLADLVGVIGVTIPRTRRYGLGAELVKDGSAYRFTSMHGTFGNSDLAGRFSVTAPATAADRLRMDAALTTRRLDIIDASPFLGYDPDIVAAKGAAAAAAATGAGPQRIMPDAALPVAAMQRFDAGLTWDIGVVRSNNVPISKIHLKLALDRGRLALAPLDFSMARGDVLSDFVFDTRQRPAAVTYDIRLAPTPMGRLLAGYGVVDAGTTGTIRGRIALKGRGDTIHDSLATASGRIAVVMPSGTLWTQNAQLAELDIGTFVQKMFEKKLKEPVRLNCGLVAFTVRDGIAATDPILIDTSKNVITGKGGFSFRDEAVDLAFRADGKKFSLFSGQSPVGIDGHFAHPELKVISKQLLARAGAGIGLAIVGTPIAGLLAFVDVGDAKAAACGPVLAGANAAAQRTTKGDARKDVGNGQTKVK